MTDGKSPKTTENQEISAKAKAARIDTAKLRRSNMRSRTVAADSLYYEADDVSYAVFDENEALKIVFPIEYQQPEEDAEAGVREKPKASLNETLSSAFLSIPDFIEKTGEASVNAICSFFSKYGALIFLPLTFLFRSAKKGARLLSERLFGTYSLFSQDVRQMRYELKIIKKQAKTSAGKERVSLTKALSKYFMLSFSRHDTFWSSVFNAVFPLAAVIICAAALVFLAGRTTALEVIYNGEHIGYVEDEATFENAKAQAQRLMPQSSAGGGETLCAEPVYRLRSVPLNLLSNQNMLCENLIDASGESLVRACGIYINGEFLCAVNSESDAVSVFASILAPSKRIEQEGRSVAFVEEIEFVQGLYPNSPDVLWDAPKLKSALKAPKSEAEYYKIKEGDSLKTIAKKSGVSAGTLKALNPSTDFSNLKVNAKILTAAQTDYVRIKVMKTKQRTVSIPYETIKKESQYLYKGTTKTSQNGRSGQKVITELVTYINGEKSYSTVVSEKTTRNPVNEIILVGTKSITSYGSSGSYGSYSGSYSGGGSYAGSSGGFIWPTRGAYTISSRFGYRNPRISGWGFHGGLDIIRSGGHSQGTPVVASSSGTVVAVTAGYSGYGHMVLIDHGNGIRTRYAHMQPGSLAVRTGQRVYKGQQIGRIGSTGNSTGPHLHFEVIRNGSRVNPLSYVR